MATVPAAQASDVRGNVSTTYEGFAASGDVGAAVYVPAGCRNISVQAVGDFTGSLSITLQGSNDDGTTWFTLHTKVIASSAQAAIALAATGALADSVEMPQMVKPTATAGTGSADADVHLFFLM